jgi:G3E family GTPase
MTGDVPLTIITGFLGSGKTTLVNRVLSQAGGQRIAVLVNEFGALGVDPQLIANSRGPVVELLNGCICCSTGSDVMGALRDVLSQSPLPDAILLETSGLADPGPVLQALDGDRRRLPVRVAGVVTVVDAANYDVNLDLAEAAFSQLAAADLLVVNKVDLVAPDIPRRIVWALAKLNPTARAVTCSNADLPGDLILATHPTGVKAAPRDHHHHENFESVVVSASRPLAPDALRFWAESLPREVIRVKGFVRLIGQPDLVAFHLVGTRPSAQPVPDDPQIAGAVLVVIGTGLNRNALQHSLEEHTQ